MAWRGRPRSPACGTGRHPGGPRRWRSGRCGCCVLCPDRSVIASALAAKGGRTHTGIDFPVQAGTPIGAAGVGVTEFAGRNSGGYGNLVVVRHRLGYTTWYAHLSTITTFVGQKVTGGTRLGFVGSTGHATGPHLHFELRKNATPIDPMPVSAADGGDPGEWDRRRSCRSGVPDPQAARSLQPRRAGRLPREEPDHAPASRATCSASTRVPSRAGRGPCRASPRPRPSRSPPRGSCGTRPPPR